MDAEQARAFALTLPHVRETVQWGDNLVFWVGDKTIGGKMFALVDLGGGKQGVISYCAGPERYAEMLERDGIFPAPYMARAFWVAAERWNALRNSEWEEELRAAHAVIFAKLTARTRTVLELPERERAKVVRERKKVLAERVKGK